MFAAISSVNNFFLAIFATLYDATKPCWLLTIFIVDHTHPKLTFKKSEELI